MNSTRQAILETLTFFDIFDYPLTKWQLEHWLWKAAAAGEQYDEVLTELLAAGKIESHWGFYYLPGRRAIVEIRQHRYMLAQLKFRVARRYARLFSFFPYIRFIGVCNTLAYNNAQDDSDIDFFVVVEPGHIWTARILTAGWLKLWHKRPTLLRSRNRICLSFFITTDKMNLQAVALPDDIYLPYWLIQLVPLFDDGDIYNRILKGNKWVKELVPNFIAYQTNPVRRINDGRGKKLFRRVLEFIFHPLEKISQRTQLKLMPLELREGVSPAVIVNDDLLKLHANDRRQHYYDIWKKRTTNV
ncbi:MAG: hypothetical protein NUV82_01095 [Candidatus Komeilibacteria bacterium]|nr:hypothetical protein [Candidatus Komeilibacteria bacterium]